MDDDLDCYYKFLCLTCNKPLHSFKKTKLICLECGKVSVVIYEESLTNFRKELEELKAKNKKLIEKYEVIEEENV